MTATLLPASAAAIALQRARTAAAAEPLIARGNVAAPETDAGEFMYMPGGISVIHCTKGTREVEVQVMVDRETAGVLQRQLDEVKARGQHRPYFDFNHADGEASFWPDAFQWKQTPRPGVYVSGEWSAVGLQASRGKSFRAFSPTFHVDDEKKKPARVICHPHKSLNFGGLVNDPAFKNNLPLWAKHAGALSSKTYNHTNMTKDELAALQAKKTTLEQEISTLVANSSGSAEDAEGIRAKQNELSTVESQIQSEELKARNQVLEQQLVAQRTKDADEAVKAAVKRGAIPIRDEPLQAAWKKKCIEDPENIELLKKVASSSALQARDLGAQPVRLTVNGLGITRESSGAVLKGLGALCARQAPSAGLSYRERPLVAREFAALYAKEILPRLKEGDDIPLSALAREFGLEAANSLGTLAQTLVATRTLELLTLTFPLLQSILTDFSDQIISYGDTLKSRFVGIPTVQTFNTTTGWPTQSDVTTTDISMTYDQWKGVPVRFLGHEVAGTVRRLFDEIAPAQGYALGKAVCDYVYALITSAYTNTGTSVPLATFGRSLVIDVGGILDDAGVPEMGRFLLLARTHYSALSKDSTIIQMAAFQKADIITKGFEATTLRDVEGFQVIKAVNLPATAVTGGTLKGFGGSKSSLAVATRLSSDYVNALPGAGNGNLTVVTAPSGISANMVQFVDHNGAYAAQRMDIIFAGSRGQIAAGALLYV